MYAIVNIAGKQYKVQKDQILDVDHLNVTNKKSSSSEVLLIWDDKQTKIGKPFIEKAKIEFEILEKDKKAKKVLILKHKAKKRYRRKIGFRPHFSKIKITKITV
ncbi:50S ribosomal protein L21 [Patescibacteria group bacterium]